MHLTMCGVDCHLTRDSLFQRAVTQWSGKEMWNFAKVILGTFAATLRRNNNQPRPTGSQIQEFNKAILCVRSITDFCLMTQYPSHTDQTVSYLRQYLREFHETKNVFLRFRAGKKAKKAATEAHKNLVREQSQASVADLTASERVKARQENALERQELVNEMLKEGAHYNFTKIHLISHYAEQIPKFGALGQYSTDISEAMHKGFKDAYRRSNKVDATTQIITTYTRDHTFAMKDFAIRTWSRIRELKEPTQGISINPAEGQVYLKLQGKIDLETVSNLEDLERMASLSNLKLAMRGFLTRELKGADSDAVRLLDRDIRAYCALLYQTLVDRGLLCISHGVLRKRDFEGKGGMIGFGSEDTLRRVWYSQTH
ncbi:hypothetical protein EV426DRAFT_13691 [Tirmania nivea]|nr:hypothetical protein EV426DRAFT_13691 [Tirmania nivea]